jgi:4,5-dihydroxyphthalate decarboxylase
MLVAGEIDAVTRYFGGSRGGAEATAAPPGDRSPMPMRELAAHPDVRWLYPDRKAAALDYQRRVGGPQPIHCIVVKQDVVDRQPWVPRSLYEAFVEAARRTQGASTVHASFPFPPEEQQQVFGADFSPVGLGGGTRELLARLLDLSAKDGFLVGGRRFAVEELFHESTLDGS